MSADWSNRMLQIAIGRRIFDTDEMLSDDAWLCFQQSVEESVMRYESVGIANTRALGVSSFNNVAEETCLLVWFDVDSLRPVTYGDLRVLATDFRQFSIAVTFGNTEFVEGV